MAAAVASVAAAEEIAVAIFVQAKLDITGDSGVAELACRLLTDEALAYRVQKEPVVVRERPWRIYIRNGLSDAEMVMALATGLAIWWLRSHPADAARTDVATLALCIAVPAEALEDAVGRRGRDTIALAEEFRVTPATIAHRLETACRPPPSSMQPRLVIDG